ncbi:transcription elongation factor TFIIS-like [Vitis riparia]|uniref:transcription elongation factor TFIIS-like n=1 Tax=Vitis riparia TaxID=96939 RepID=UPI00155B1972|nr:transcription elongation factor TFIIS-like [Vitis riparia]
MEKELLELFEATKKAADAAAVNSGAPSEEERCLDALKQLKDFPVTYQVLVSTQVGKRLRTLTKHPTKKIQALASDLIDIWKNIVIEETTKNKKNGDLEDKESPKPVTANPENVKATPLLKVSKAENIKVEKQTSGVKKPSHNIVGPPKLTSISKCNDALRDKVRELLSEALSKVVGEADEDIMDAVNACDPIRVAVSVESVMFEKWGRSSGAHKLKYRSLMFNIKDAKNPDLRRKVLLGQVMPERLLEMGPEEMASDRRQRENQQIKEKALFDCELGAAPKATTDQFKCGRCGQRKTTYYQLQTRSADEPMTTFVTCVNCNNHWKFC